MHDYRITTVAVTNRPASNYRGEGKGREKEGKGTLPRPPSSTADVEVPSPVVAAEQAAFTTQSAQVQAPTRARDTATVDTTHPHPDMIEPRNWCTACRTHDAHGTLCPVCKDDQAHGINILITATQPQDGRGTD